MKKLLLTLTFFTLCLFQAGMLPAASATELTIAITRDENTLTPFTYVTGSPGAEVMALIFDSLMTISPDNAVIPWMIDDLEIDASSQTYRFRLKDGLMWHDGHPLTANDVIFSFKYPMSQSASRWIKICRQIDKVTAEGSEISIKLKQSNPYFAREGLADLPIIPRHIYENVKDASAFGQTVGSGPFKMLQYLPGQAYTLERTEYFQGLPLVAKIMMPIISDKSTAMQALAAGKLDALTSSLPPEAARWLSSQSGLTLLSGLGYSPNLLYFNCERYPFNDANVRRAFSLAINKNSLAEVVHLGHAKIGAGVLAAPDSELYSDWPSKFDLDEANRLLDLAGYAARNDQGLRLMNGHPMEFSLLAYSDALIIRTAEMIAQDLLKVGVALKVAALDSDTVDSLVWPEFDVKKRGNYDLALWSWSAPVQLNPSAPISLLSSDPALGNLNIGGFKSQTIDDLCRTYVSTDSMAGREKIALDIYEQAYLEMPFVVLNYNDVLNAANTEKYESWRMRRGVGIINKFSFLPGSY
jgi:peptide/nickel transport system substrate-binding protein